MKNSVVRTCALLAALGVAACGDDGPTATGDPLTDAEAQALSGIILESAFQSTVGGVPAPAATDGPQAAPFSYSASVDTSLPCTGGGTVAISGSATINGDDETGEYAVTYNVTEAHNNCVETGANDQSFTINSALSLGFVLDVISDGQVSSIDWDGTLTGTVDWATGDKSGSCSLSLSYAASFSGQSITATSNGTICGTTVSEEFTYGIST
jgi:hypothetical protein